jgi:uncharacterized protein YcfJ
MSKPAVFGIVDNESQAQAAISQLETAGFLPSDISVLSRGAGGTVVDSGDVLAPEVTTTDGSTRNVAHENTTKAPEGATTGVVSGGAIGAIAGWLIGIGALAIPGVGPFIAAGPILAALSGAAIGAAAGGITGALIGYGIPEYEAKLYAGYLDKGHILVGVHATTSEESSAAKKALEAAGAHDLKVTSEVEAKS